VHAVLAAWSVTGPKLSVRPGNPTIFRLLVDVIVARTVAGSSALFCTTAEQLVSAPTGIVNGSQELLTVTSGVVDASLGENATGRCMVCGPLACTRSI
jgi:hypothetical protein